MGASFVPLSVVVPDFSKDASIYGEVRDHYDCERNKSALVSRQHRSR